MCIIKVLAPQPNTDTTRHPEEMETEEQDKVPVLREIKRNIEEPKIERDLHLRKSTREKKRPAWHDSYAIIQKGKHIK